MNPKTFRPVLFIDIGAHQHFFTLRETYLHTRYVPGDGPMGNAVVNGVYQGAVEYEVRSFHHQNLSQEPAEAFAKATALAEAMGLELDASEADLGQRLADIRRATAKELERRNQEQAEREARWAEERAAREEARRQMIREGLFPFGVHEGKKFSEMDCGYINWIARKAQDFEPGSLMRAVADELLVNHRALLLPEPTRGAFWKSEGVRAVTNVTVTRVNSFTRAKFNAPWLSEVVYIVTMVADSGECLVSKGTSFVPEVGERFTIKCTVKEHGWYGDQAQTVVQRIVIVSEKEISK